MQRWMQCAGNRRTEMHQRREILEVPWGNAALGTGKCLNWFRSCCWYDHCKLCKMICKACWSFSWAHELSFLVQRYGEESDWQTFWKCKVSLTTLWRQRRVAAMWSSSASITWRYRSSWRVQCCWCTMILRFPQRIAIFWIAPVTILTGDTWWALQIFYTVDTRHNT
jgi:hypothetical protein